jgi:tRNA (guanine26-N2/guanine27-N2)-dimethyltransferase
VGGVTREGQAQFRVNDAFFRSTTVVARDLGILAALYYRQTQGLLQVLDGMAGCGVRSLRYALEAGADWVWANDGNPDLQSTLVQNLAATLRAEQFQVTSDSLRQVLNTCMGQHQRFDLIDLDGFGSPADDLGMALACLKLGGYLYLTSTDGQGLSGHNSTGALRRFGVYTRVHPAPHEQGLRVLLGLVGQQAQMQGLAIRPLFSWCCGQTYRVMVRLETSGVWDMATSGFLGYCHACGQFASIPWPELGRSCCRNHDSPHPWTLSGPLWLGPLHNPKLLMVMDPLAIERGWTARSALIQRMLAEHDLPPYYYPLGEIGRRGKLDIPKRDRLIAALQAQGYQACIASMQTQAIKSNAPIQEIVAIAKALF